MLTLFVVSVRTMFVYETLARTSGWPPGQVKLPVEIGPAVRLATTGPFLTSSEPPADTSA